MRRMWAACLLIALAGPACGQGWLIGFHGGVTWKTRSTLVPHGRQLGRLNVWKTADVPIGLAGRAEVAFVEEDKLVPAGVVPNDPGYGSQWYLGNISAPLAWDLTTGSTAVTVAVLDTGVNGSNPDLLPNLVAGWNFVDNNSNTSDVQGHGTAVAGCVGAAGNNGIGIASVSWSSRIMPVRIAFNQNGYAYAYWSTVAQGMQWAVDNGARIENCSYVGLAGSGTIKTAAAYVVSHGGCFVACAGNDNADPGFPADQNIIIVAGTESANNRASFSDYGQFVTVSAPATSIYTTSGTGYATWQGTSFASPIVAGVLALEYAANPNLTPDVARQALIDSCDDLGAVGWDAYFGYGKVNAYRAVTTAQSIVLPPPPAPVDTTPPACQITSPADGSAVGSRVQVTVGASDNVGVASVTLTVDGGQAKTDTAAPWAFTLQTKRWSSGAHTLTAVARDAAGNQSAPSTIQVSK